MAARGIHQEPSGRWVVDRKYRGQRLFRRFESFEDAEGWLIHKLEGLRKQDLLGERPTVLFGEAAAEFTKREDGRAGFATDQHLLEAVLPYIADLPIDKIDGDALKQFVEDRQNGCALQLPPEPGKRRAPQRPVKAKTINGSLEIVRRILTQATEWKHKGSDLTWLERAPKIELLSLNDKRQPRPITWAEQKELFAHLPLHLRRMALFVLNTGVRDEVVCNLRWDWVHEVDELGITFIVVPPEFVKNGLKDPAKPIEGFIACNSIVRQLLGEVRGMHDDYVFVWRRERVKNFDEAPAMTYRPMTEGMLNTAWINACRKAGLDGLHVHDLRHTVGMRLREMNVRDQTRADILWHKHADMQMTAHYSQAQIVEIRDALELIAEDSGTANKTVQTLILEARAAKRTAGAKKAQEAAQKSRKAHAETPTTESKKSGRIASKAGSAAPKSVAGARQGKADPEGKSAVSHAKLTQEKKRT